MDYFVIATDGQEYGPANLDTLRAWSQDGRVHPTTMLKNFSTGQVTPASSVEGIFPEVTAPPQAPPAAAYPRYGPGMATGYKTNPSGSSDVWGAIFRSALALVFFFAFHGIGLIVGGYALFYGIRSFSSGHKHGLTALIISVCTFVIICIGWAIRFSQTSPR